MSLKTTAFSTILPIPQTIDRFAVIIPNIVDSPMRVYAASLPMDYRDTLTVNCTGVPVNLPGKRLYTGTWTCKIYESALMDVGIQIDLFQRLAQSTDARNTPITHVLLPVTVTMLDEHSNCIPNFVRIMKGAYIESVSEPTIDWSQPGTPLSWNVTFRYTSLLW